MLNIGATELLLLFVLFGIFILPLVALVVVVLIRGQKKKKTQD